MEQKSERIFLWALAAVVPMVMMVGSFAVDHWNWGLMDDLGMLAQSGGWWHRVVTLSSSWFSCGSDRPVSAAYAATFYPLFKNSPQGFYFFKLLLVGVTLLIWGAAAAALTRNRVALLLVPAIALSFGYFYDAFGYLSVQEPQGLFFIGLSVLLLARGGILLADDQKPVRWGMVGTGIGCLILAALCKEVFSGSVFSVGAALGILGLIRRRTDLTLIGLAIVITATAYMIYLKFFFAHGYSARYDLNNIGTIRFSFNTWVSCSAVYHIPWLVFIVTALVRRWRGKHPWLSGATVLPGVLAGVLLYSSFLLLMLPWQTTDFYVIPLGVYFAFGATMILAEFFSSCGVWILRGAVLISMAMNILVCQASFGATAAYRKDTGQLLDWMQHNQQFHQDIEAGFTGATNAMEAGATIPALLKRETGIKAPQFIEYTMVKDIISDPKVVYYLYDPKMGDQDLRKINMMWSVVYSSKSWTLFRRIFWLKP